MTACLPVILSHLKCTQLLKCMLRRNGQSHSLLAHASSATNQRFFIFLETLQATEAGLDDAEVKRRLDQYGYNKLPESTRIPFLVFLGYLWNPLSWAMEVAALLAIILLDYADFCLIIALLLVNATIRCALWTFCE